MLRKDESNNFDNDGNQMQLRRSRRLSKLTSPFPDILTSTPATGSRYRGRPRKTTPGITNTHENIFNFQTPLSASESRFHLRSQCNTDHCFHHDSLTPLQSKRIRQISEEIIDSTGFTFRKNKTPAAFSAENVYPEDNNDYEIELESASDTSDTEYMMDSSFNQNTNNASKSSISNRSNSRSTNQSNKISKRTYRPQPSNLCEGTSTQDENRDILLSVSDDEGTNVQVGQFSISRQCQPVVPWCDYFSYLPLHWKVVTGAPNFWVLPFYMIMHLIISITQLPNTLFKALRNLFSEENKERIVNTRTRIRRMFTTQTAGVDGQDIYMTTTLRQPIMFWYNRPLVWILLFPLLLLLLWGLNYYFNIFGGSFGPLGDSQIYELNRRMDDLYKKLDQLDPDLAEKMAKLSISGSNDPMIDRRLDALEGALRQLQRGLADGSSNVYSSEDQRVMQLINQALEQFAADRIGMPDYALETVGGSILGTRCTTTYNKHPQIVSLFGLPLLHFTRSPRVIIQPGTNAGECWAFEGKIGSVVIQLATSINITAVTLEHIPRSVAPRGNVNSAPKDFSIKGLTSSYDYNGVVLANLQYDIDGSSIQTFPVYSTRAYKFVELAIMSNHGNDAYTCVYRFRVHGNPS